MDLFGEPETPTPSPAPPLSPPALEEAFFDHPRLMLGAQGHEDIEAHLLTLFKRNRLPHGLVFSGPKGIGKATTAYHLARFLLKHGAGDTTQDSLHIHLEDPTFRLVASGGHPDLLSIERAYDTAKNQFQKGVTVADIRKIAPFLHMTSSEGGWRIVIIDDADTMNRNAQNALLKILEEPPKKTLLILVAHRAGALIPTLRSRTQNLHFSPLSQEVFDPIMRQFDPELDPESIQTLCHLTGGSIGAAIEYVENDGLEMLSRLLDIIKDAPLWNWSEIHKLGNELARSTKGNAKGNAYKNFRTLLVWVFTEMITAQARTLPPPSGILQHHLAIETMMQNSSLEKLLETCENLQAYFNQVERTNLDKKQAVLQAFSIISA